MKYFISFLLINSLLVGFYQTASAQGIEQPQTMEEAKGLGLDILKKLPNATINVWQKEALPFLMKMWAWVKDIWDRFLGERVLSWWQKIISLTGKQTPDLKVELEKEKQEIQTDLPKVGETLWERLQQLIKK